MNGNGTATAVTDLIGQMKALGAEPTKHTPEQAYQWLRNNAREKTPARLWFREQEMRSNPRGREAFRREWQDACRALRAGYTETSAAPASPRAETDADVCAVCGRDLSAMPKGSLVMHGRKHVRAGEAREERRDGETVFVALGSVK